MRSWLDEIHFGDVEFGNDVAMSIQLNQVVEFIVTDSINLSSQGPHHYPTT